MPKKRVYKKGEPGSEYDAYHGKPSKLKRHAERNRARYAAEKAGKVKKGDGKELDHQGYHRTGSLEKVPVKIVSKKQNRSRQPKRP